MNRHLDPGDDNPAIPALAPTRRLQIDVHAGPISATAVFSPARTHRYLLTRGWGRARRMVLLMLNPSTADATTDDPTIARVTRFAIREGCGGLAVLNLFALRATDPDELARSADPVGPDNDDMIDALTADPGQPVVLAWGAIAYRSAHRPRTDAVTARLQARGVPLRCLGRTRAGHPRHPLYLPATAPLTPWQPPAQIAHQADQKPCTTRKMENNR